METWWQFGGNRAQLPVFSLEVPLLRISRSHEGYTRDFVGKYRIIGGDRADIVQFRVNIRRAANICMVAGGQ